MKRSRKLLLAIATILIVVLNIKFSIADNKFSIVNLNNTIKNALADGENPGSEICYWVQIAHAPDYSWIEVQCMDHLYPDPTGVNCEPCDGRKDTWWDEF